MYARNNDLLTIVARSGEPLLIVIPGRALARTRNLEVLRCAIAHHSSMLGSAPRNDIVSFMRLLLRPVIGDAADHGARPKLLPQTVYCAFGVYGAAVEHVGIVGL